MLELHRRAHSIAECLRGLFDGGTVAGTEFKAGKIRGVGNGIRVAAVSKKIEYYDDEELDQFIGKEANAYTDEETNQFRDVLYTMQDIDVAGWVRSLQLRGIELPDDLKDEVFLIIGERRNIEVKKADDR